MNICKIKIHINISVFLYQNMQCDFTCSSSVYVVREDFHSKSGNFYVFLYLMIYLSY